MFVVGIANRLRISEKRPIIFWYNTLDALEKNKNKEYNFKKIIVGSLIYIMMKNFYNKK